MHEGVSERHSTFRSYSGGPGSFLWEGLGLRDPKSVRGVGVWEIEHARGFRS